MFRAILAGAVAFGLALVVGCGGGGGKTAKVSGVVTYKGQPVKKVVVTFTPANGRPARGETDEQGQFTLSTFAPGDGAVPGQHKVTLTRSGGSTPEPMPGTPEAATYKPEPLPFPAKYSAAEQSGLTANVEAGKTNEVKFELTD